MRARCRMWPSKIEHPSPATAAAPSPSRGRGELFFPSPVAGRGAGVREYYIVIGVCSAARMRTRTSSVSFASPW